MIIRPVYVLMTLIVVCFIITFFVLTTIFRTHDVNMKVTLGILELLILVYFTFTAYRMRSVIEQETEK